MSLFRRTFGGGKASEKSFSIEEDVKKLSEIDDLLRKRQNILEKKIDDEFKIVNRRTSSNHMVRVLRHYAARKRNLLKRGLRGSPR